jgi:hypothetical protein
MFVGERYVLQDRQKAIVSLEALDQVMQGMQSHQRMQRPTVMAGWKV